MLDIRLKQENDIANGNNNYRITEKKKKCSLKTYLT